MVDFSIDVRLASYGSLKKFAVENPVLFDVLLLLIIFIPLINSRT